jgi:hypothetical protein
MADGMSQVEASKAIGCNRITVHRWCQKEDFAAALDAEIERRRNRVATKLQEAANEQIDKDVADLKTELANYHQAIVNVQKQRLIRGREMMEKAMRRLKDLPEEALSAADAVRLYQAGDNAIEKGLGNWGEALAIEDLMRRMNDGGQ